MTARVELACQTQDLARDRPGGRFDNDANAGFGDIAGDVAERDGPTELWRPGNRREAPGTIHAVAG